jgi:hypothetical protein
VQNSVDRGILVRRDDDRACAHRMLADCIVGRCGKTTVRDMLHSVAERFNPTRRISVVLMFTTRLPLRAVH